MNHYEQYLERSVLTASPIELVRILYRFVIDNLRDASRCVVEGNIEGRGHAVSKATDGLLELLTSLDHQNGGEVSARLAELYGYATSRVLQGHVDQQAEPFEEVERIMTTLLESWEQIGQPEIADIPGMPYGSASEPYTPISAIF